MPKFFYLLTLAFSFCICAHAQVENIADNKILQFPNKLFLKIKSRTDNLDEQLTRQTEKYLRRLEKKEISLQKKMAKKDSASAKILFEGAITKYEYYINRVKSEHDSSSRNLSGEYLPNIDSLKGSLSFLNSNKQLVNTGSGVQQNITATLGSFNQLQNKFQSSDEIRAFIRDRKQQLHDALARYENSLGLDKYMQEYNKQLYYYSEQVREYREMLNNPDKLEQKIFALLNKLPAFQDFMKRNAQLAGLFIVPGNYGSAQGVEGLQTHDEVMQSIQGQLNSGNGDMSAVNAGIESAHEQLDAFKDKLGELGGGSGDMDMPGFKPNNQKTKSFLKRLELGTNLQTTRAGYFFPATTDFGLSIGYKVNNGITAGIGASYKVGWGSGINHIAVTSEGAGLRSFFDFKLKGNFYGSGGLEYNYQQPFSSFRQINNLGAWQQSGLVGITRMMSLAGKVVKKTKVQLLWDFLSYYQLPRTQPLKFRIGYNF